MRLHRVPDVGYAVDQTIGGRLWRLAWMPYPWVLSGASKRDTIFYRLRGLTVWHVRVLWVAFGWNQDP